MKFMPKKLFLFLLIVPVVYSCNNSIAEVVTARAGYNVEAGAEATTIIPSFKMVEACWLKRYHSYTADILLK